MQRLTPQLLLSAYAQGVFPMADDDGTVYWYDPDPRAIFPLDAFHVPRRLAQTVRQGRFEARADSDFRGVMEGCAERERTWISEEIIEAYTALHRLGFAHSSETWQDGRLVGGVYGVAIRGLFAGESMFSRERDASKVALVHLVERLRVGGYELFDVQYTNPHLEQFGVVEIPRRQYHRRLAAALAKEAEWTAIDGGR
ncbi:MAG TPA: leucyl/phenylalanyl-tRNA--protein transferase [Ardenticatenaceae bacterium]|jgi:leucyl/phenylalanyl-tRNA--protein transferase